MTQHRVQAVGDQTSLADWKRRAGQRLVIGLAGTAVDDDLRKLVAAIRPAGFILFARNVAEPRQVLELNRELASLVPRESPALLCVDQEGGRVRRVKNTNWPPMRTVAQAERYTAEVSRGIAEELRSLGFNLNFAPVADVNSNPDNPVIGDRAFGDRPDVVGPHVAAFIRAHQESGVIACAKHFPGHGDTSVDSHKALPIVERDRDDLRHVELPPFRAAVEAGVATLMSSHVLYPAWDEEWPATLSPTIIPTLLREELGFEGVVFSDDMEMKAVHGRYGVDQQVEQATCASIDILLACKDPELQWSFYEALVKLQERDQRFETATKHSVARVDALREQFFLNHVPPPPLSVVGCAKHQALAQRISTLGGVS